MFSILSEVTCDLTLQQVNHYNIITIPMPVYLGDSIQFLDTSDHAAFSINDFFEALANKMMPKTSQAQLSTFLELFEAEFKKGNDILYVGFDSALSGSYNTACLALNQLQEDYPDRQYRTVDSLQVSLGQGQLSILAANLRAQGKTLEETYQVVAEYAPKSSLFGTINDLFYLQRNGRLSAASSLVGSVLNVKPLIRVASDGKLSNYSSTRGRNNSLKAVVKDCMKVYDTEINSDFYITHARCENDALFLKETLVNEYHINPDKIFITECGMVVGSHTGPGYVALFSYSTRRD